jgi:hypothetical protein
VLICGFQSAKRGTKESGEEKALIAVAPNRNNVEIKNRRNSLRILHILISNRDKNHVLGSPQFRPNLRPKPLEIAYV